MRKITKIIIDSSDSLWGDVRYFNQLSKERGFSEAGHHYIILNGYDTQERYQAKKRLKSRDGEIEKGRNISDKSRCCKGHNKDAITILLVGKKSFTKSQLDTLYKLVIYLCVKYTIKDVFGYYELNNDRQAPYLDMDQVRLKIMDEIVGIWSSY